MLRTNTEIEAYCNVQIIKCLRLIWYVHVEKMQNQRMPKKNVAGRMKGNGKGKDKKTTT